MLNKVCAKRIVFRFALLGSMIIHPGLTYGEETQVIAASRNWNFVARHLQVLQFEQFNRFNYMDSGPDTVNARDSQYRIRTRTQIDLLRSGATYFRMRAETGQGFNNSWNNIGGGFGHAQYNFYIKTFTIGQKFGSHVELQGGGLEFDPGAGTQHTYASGDSAMVGYRGMLIGSNSAWHPEKFGLTMGYVGDFDQSNFFLRSHMGKLNYAQALVQKDLRDDSELSVEADSIRNIWFTREAIHWKRRIGRIFDDAIVEAVTRATDNASFGWSATISRRFGWAEHWQALAIYSDMPQGLYLKQGQAILLNQGEISTGKRLSWGIDCALAKNLNMSLFSGRRLDNTPSLRWVAQFGVSYQYAGLINHLLGRRNSVDVVAK